MTDQMYNNIQSDLKFDFLRYANAWLSSNKPRADLKDVPSHLYKDLGI